MIAHTRVAIAPLAAPARRIAAGLALAALLVSLGACAAGNTTSSLATPATASASPAPASAAAAPATAAAAPAPAAPSTAAAAPAAPAAPPQHLTQTEINEKCWMRTETFHKDDLDKRMKLVDKCVEEMTKAQGGV